MDWRERAVELVKDYGLSYKETSNILYNEMGVLVSDDAIRYHAKRKSKKNEARQVMQKENKTKTLVLTDLHIPFHREEEIIEIILKHRDEIDTIIFGGDIVDCESVSHFPKINRLTLIQEMVLTYKFLRRIDKLTPNIKKILIWGNHEYRYVRYLADNQTALTSLHSDNILLEIVDGFTHYDRDAKKKTKYPALGDNFKVINKWFYQHGDMIVAHPKNFSKINVRIATQAVDYFISQGYIFNAVMVGHTHKQGTTTKYGKWTCETGCLCKAMEYSSNGNLGYTPQDYGYGIITQINGITSINESRIFKLDFKDGDESWQEGQPE